MKSLIALPTLLGALAISAAAAHEHPEHHHRPMDINVELRRIELKVVLESYARVLNLRSEASLDLALVGIEPNAADVASRRQALSRRLELLTRLATELENQARQIHAQLHPHHRRPQVHDLFDEPSHAPDQHAHPRDQPLRDPDIPRDVPNDAPRRGQEDRFERDPRPVPSQDQRTPFDRTRRLEDRAPDVDEASGIEEPAEDLRDDNFKTFDLPQSEPALEDSGVVEDTNSDFDDSDLLEDAIGP